MNFHYHPILGMQFTCGLAIYEIDLVTLPESNLSFEEILKLIHQKRIMLTDSSTSPITNIFHRITSNLFSCNQ